MTDVDVSVPAQLFADPARARLLMALADGRALPATRLAAEAGVAASTASGHLARLLAGGAVQVHAQGRHRYYRIADPRIVRILEDLASLAPPAPVRSMREGTRAHALRRARLCYDHLAGRLGVSLMAGLIATGVLEGGDGRHHLEHASQDRLSAPGQDVDYRLTEHGETVLADWGLDLTTLRAGRRPLVRYCVDWTEQRHHLAGGLGAALATNMVDRGWLRHLPIPRAVRLTEAGEGALGPLLGDHQPATPRRRPPR